MTSYLDLEARLGGEFIHPGGDAITRVLKQWLDLKSDDTALEIGGGSGATAALIARESGAHITLLDRSAAMLAAARERLREMRLSHGVDLVRMEASRVLAVGSVTFDAVYAESVVALLDVDAIIAECARVLKPGGRLVFNERIWRSGTSQPEVDRVNALSRQVYGIPAATSRPLDRDDWLQLMRDAGLKDAHAVTVDSLLAGRRPPAAVRYRLRRLAHYLRRPHLLAQSWQFKRQTCRYAALFDHMESYVFSARKPA